MVTSGQFSASPKQARMGGGINDQSTMSPPYHTYPQNFGLDYDAFQHMVGDCPPDFLQLTFNCCNVSVSLPFPPPNFGQGLAEPLSSG